MIDQNRLYNYIIVSILVFLVIIVLSIYFGGQKGKLDALNNFSSWKKRIDNRAYRIDKNIIKMKTEMDIQFNGMFVERAKNAGFLFKIGKLRFTKKGASIAKKIKAGDFVNYNWNKINSDLKKALEKNESPTAYDIQTASISVALLQEKILIYSERKRMKDLAYSCGISYETLFIFHGLLIRDKYLKKNSIASPSSAAQKKKKSRFTRKDSYTKSKKRKRAWE